MKPKLVIVEKNATQFDVPLYDFLTRKAAFDVTVFYTQAHHDKSGFIDREIERKPQWDHLQECKYDQRKLNAKEVADAQRAAEKIALLQPDLVILCGYSPLLHAKLAWFLKRKKVRIGLRSDNTLPHSSFKGPKGLAKKILLPFWLRQYDTWHPVGTLARQYLETMAGIKKPAYLFPYNIDNEWFHRESTGHRHNRDELRKGMGFSSEDKVVLGIMKWHEREDPVTLIDAFSKLRNKCPNVRLILVGDGPLRDIVWAKAKSLGSGIFMPGYVPYSELPKYYAISDIFVHSAVNEHWGVSVNESMACGLPVIAAEGVGSAPDLIVEGGTGATFPDRNSDALSEKISYLLNDPGLLEKMGKAAREKISQWSYEQTYQEFLKALEGK